MSASPSSADSLLAIKSLTIAPKIKQKMSADFSAQSSDKNSENRFRDEFKKADEKVTNKRSDNKPDVEKNSKIAEKNSEKDGVKTSKNEPDTNNRRAEKRNNNVDKDVDNADESASASNDASVKNSVHANAEKSSRMDENADANMQDEECADEHTITAIDPALAPDNAAQSATEGGELLPQGGQTMSAALPPLSSLDGVATTDATLAETASAKTTAAENDAVGGAAGALLTPTPNGQTAATQTPLMSGAVNAAIDHADIDQADLQTSTSLAGQSRAAAQLSEEARLAVPLSAEQLTAEKLAQEQAAQATLTDSEIVDPALLDKHNPVSAEDATKAASASATDATTLAAEISNTSPRTAENSARDGEEESSSPDEQLDPLLKSQTMKAGADNYNQEGVKQTARTDIPLPAFQGAAPTAKVDAIANAAKAATEKGETKPSANIESASTVRATPHDNKWAQTLSTLQQIRGNSSENAQFKLPMSLQNKEWGSAVADKVMWMASKNIQSAEVHLDPPELGPMQVRIAVNQEHVSVNFISHNATVRDMLDQNSFRLREMFDQGGMNLVDVDVSDRHAQQRQQENGEGSPGGQLQSGIDGDVIPEPQNLATALALTNLVDYYA